MSGTWIPILVPCSGSSKRSQRFEICVDFKSDVISLSFPLPQFTKGLGHTCTHTRGVSPLYSWADTSAGPDQEYQDFHDVRDATVITTQTGHRRMVEGRRFGRFPAWKIGASYTGNR